MKVYDVFQGKWVMPDEVDNIAPPERYIYIDVPDLEPQDEYKSLDIVKELI